MGVFDELNNEVLNPAIHEWNAQIQTYIETELVEIQTLELRQCN